MSIVRRTYIDDDGSGLVGPVWNSAEIQAFYDTIDARWAMAFIFATGVQHDLALTYSGIEADVLYCQNATDLTITGIVAPSNPPKPGKPLVVVAQGTGHVFLAPTHTGSAPANRLYNHATSGLTPLKSGRGYAVYRRNDNAGVWVMEAHDQGGYLTAPFAAGNFTGNGAMTWTVATGDRTSQYYLQGGRLHYTWNLANTTVGGTPNTRLQIGAAEWGGFTLQGAPHRRLAIALDNGTSVPDAYALVASGTTIACTRIAGNWSASTDNTYVYGDLEAEVV